MTLDESIPIKIISKEINLLEKELKGAKWSRKKVSNRMGWVE